MKKSGCCSSNDHAHDHKHGNSILDELICHFPYAIFSVALSLSVLSFTTYLTYHVWDPQLQSGGASILFHSFHFLHIVFATTGTLIAFFRYSQNTLRGILVGIVTTIIFCTTSDAVLPYLGGRMLGVDMHFHLCFLSELKNVLPFLGIGILNGVIMGKYHKISNGFYSVFSHFFHILISSFASTFYLVSHGMVHWYSSIGMVFLFLVVAVVIPCTLSDVVIPIAAAKADKKNERN
ncbi:hypothetical protein KAH94_02030 [bacterium]|nr:hypothetical protein [bacterium]